MIRRLGTVTIGLNGVRNQKHSTDGKAGARMSGEVSDELRSGIVGGCNQRQSKRRNSSTVKPASRTIPPSVKALIGLCRGIVTW
jgi:hypothetical protein